MSWFRRHAPTPPGSEAGLGVRRRLLTLLALVAVAAAPAGVLRAFCAGHSCDEEASASSEVPFCSLPPALRDRIAAGFREGRSPDLLAVAGATAVADAAEWPPVPWPSAEDDDAARVPIVFWGTGVDADAPIPDGTGLDSISPTIASILGFRPPHPGVRSGEAIDGVANGERPRLVVEVVWVGRGSRDVEAAGGLPFLDSMIEDGAATLEGDVESLPLDPPAVLTTIGTGGHPSQHGITGTLVRDDDGRLRKAWSPKTPVWVIATLGDDLDQELRQQPVIAMAGGSRSYRGAVGGGWYPDVDVDRFVKTRRGHESRSVRALLRRELGRDDVPDLAVIAVEGGAAELDRTLQAAARRADRISGGSATIVFTATGSIAGRDVDAVDPADVSAQIEARHGAPVVEAAVPGGLFLDQDELARRKISEDEVLRSLTSVTLPDAPQRLFADVFPAIAVAFGRYC